VPSDLKTFAWPMILTLVVAEFQKSPKPVFCRACGDRSDVNGALLCEVRDMSLMTSSQSHDVCRFCLPSGTQRGSRTGDLKCNAGVTNPSLQWVNETPITYLNTYRLIPCA